MNRGNPLVQALSLIVAAALLGLTRFQLYTRPKRYRIEVSPD